jgi:hypothetical protein
MRHVQPTGLPLVRRSGLASHDDLLSQGDRARCSRFTSRLDIATGGSSSCPCAGSSLTVMQRSFANSCRAIESVLVECRTLRATVLRLYAENGASDLTEVLRFNEAIREALTESMSSSRRGAHRGRAGATDGRCALVDSSRRRARPFQCVPSGW